MISLYLPYSHIIRVTLHTGVLLFSGVQGVHDKHEIDNTNDVSLVDLVPLKVWELFFCH